MDALAAETGQREKAVLATPGPLVQAGVVERAAEEQAVLGRFFRGERLTEIPSQRSKRLVVLDRAHGEYWRSGGRVD